MYDSPKAAHFTGGRIAIRWRAADAVRHAGVTDMQRLTESDVRTIDNICRVLFDGVKLRDEYRRVADGLPT